MRVFPKSVRDNDDWVIRTIDDEVVDKTFIDRKWQHGEPNLVCEDQIQCQKYHHMWLMLVV